MTKAPSVSQMWDGAALFFALRMICAAAAGRNALNVKLRGGARRLRYAAADERRVAVVGWRLLPKDECAFETARGDCDMRRVPKDGAIAGRLAACGERWMAVVGQCLPLKCKKHIRDKQATGAVAGGGAATVVCGAC